MFRPIREVSSQAFVNIAPPSISTLFSRKPSAQYDTDVCTRRWNRAGNACARCGVTRNLFEMNNQKKQLTGDSAPTSIDCFLPKTYLDVDKPAAWVHKISVRGNTSRVWSQFPQNANVPSGPRKRKIALPEGVVSGIYEYTKLKLNNILCRSWVLAITLAPVFTRHIPTGGIRQSYKIQICLLGVPPSSHIHIYLCVQKIKTKPLSLGLQSA